MAAGLDGDINIGLNMNTKSAEQSLSSFRKKLRDGFSTTDTKSLDQSIKQTEKTIKQLETSIEKTKQKLQELSQSSTPPKSVIAMERELTQLEKQLAKADSDFKKLSNEQADLASRQVPGLTLQQSLSPEQFARFQELDTLIIKNGEDTDRLNARIKELKTKLAEVKANPKLTEEGKKYTNEINNANIKLREQQQIYNNLQNKQSKLNNKVKEQSASQAKNNAVSKQAIPIIGGIGSTLSRILKLAKRVFIFSLITKGLRALRTGLINIISADSQLSSSLAQIKGNLLTAFAPIYNACLPALRSLMSALSTATAYVASFISMLFGKSVKSSKTAAKSLYSVASAADTAGSSAKKAGKDAKKAGKDVEKSLYSFDELNQLDSSASDQDDSDSGGGGGGGGAGGGITPDFNSNIPDTSIWDNFKDIITKIKDIFMSGFWKGFESADFTPIITSLDSIKQSLIDIFLAPDTIQSAQTMVKSLIFMFGTITGSIASIGVTIVSNLLQAMAKYLSENKDFIKNSIISVFDITTEIARIVGDWWAALANVFSVLADTNGVRLTAAIIGIFSNAALGIGVLASKISRDFITYLCQPLIDNQEPLKQAIDSLLDIFASLFEGIKTIIDNIIIKFNTLYDNSIKPFTQRITKARSELMRKGLDMYNTYLAPTLKSIGTDFKNLINKTINPTVDKFFNLLDKLITIIAEAASTIYRILSPVLDWLLTNIGTKLSGTLKTFWSLIKTIITSICNLLNIILDTLIGISDFIINVFQGNWTGAWKSIQSTFKKIVSDFTKFGKDIITGLLNGIKTIGNSIKEWAKKSIIEPFKNLFGIHSPSTVFKDFGTNMIQGLLNGIDSLKDSTINWFKDRWTDIQNVFSTVNTWFGDKFSDAWKAITNAFSKMKEWSQEKFSDIQNVFNVVNIWFGNKFSDAWAAITNAFSNVREWFSSRFEDIKSVFYNIPEHFKNWFGNAWSSIKAVFNDWGSFFQNLWNIIKTTFADLGVKLGSAMGNAIRTGVNKVINWIQTTINNAIKLINGAITLINKIPGVHVGYVHTITLPTIPPLAKGAVLPPNQPFLAMVGDQKHGTNIEAPLTTIQEALSKELDKRQSYNNAGNITLQLALDERVFGQIVIKAAELEKARKGNSFVKTNVSFA